MTQESATPENEAALEAEVERLRELLNDAEARLKAHRIAATGFKVGDIVLANWQRKTKRGILRRIKPLYGSGCWYYVAFERKDGSWGTREHLVLGGIQHAPPLVAGLGVSDNKKETQQ